MIETGWSIGRFEQMEQHIHFVGNFLIGGQQTVVRIYFGGGFVKITGTDVGIVHVVSFFFSPDQQQFGVYFIAGQGFDDGYTFFFEFTCPVDIGFFIKPGLNLQKHRHIFPVSGSIDQSIDHVGVAGCPIKSHFDPPDFRVDGCFAQ